MSDGKDNCEAAWYLGLVFMKKMEWPRAATEFENVMGCYQARQDENENFKREMAAKADLDPEFKARQLANFDAVIQESVSQRHAGAFNAAQFSRARRHRRQGEGTSRDRGEGSHARRSRRRAAQGPRRRRTARESPGF